MKTLKNLVVAGVIAAVSVTTATAQSLPPELSCSINQAFKKCASIGANDVSMCRMLGETLAGLLLSKGVSPPLAAQLGQACTASCLAGSTNLRKAYKNIDESFPCK